MTNETLISVPLNIDDTNILRRFLQQIVERIDITTGSRGGDAYVPQSQLESAEAILGLSSVELAAVIVQLQEDVISLQEELQQLTDDMSDDFDREQELAWLKGWSLKFIGRATNGSCVKSEFYNVDTCERLSIGLYEVTLIQTSINGLDVLANASAAISALFTSTAFTVTFDPTTPGVFQLTILDSAGALLDPVVVGDTVVCAGLLNNEGELPEL